MASTTRDLIVRVTEKGGKGQIIELLLAEEATARQLRSELARALHLDDDDVVLERPGADEELALAVSLRELRRAAGESERDGALHLVYSMQSGQDLLAPPSASAGQSTQPADVAGPFTSGGNAGSGLPEAAPHPLPEGASATDISACTFLNSRRGADASAAVAVPSNGGRVPAMLYVALALDMCAVALVIPLLPAFSRLLGGDAAFAGALQATYGLAQVLGASFLGGLSDRHGRRPVLQLSLAGGMVGYALLSAAVGLRLDRRWLLLSRLPIGLTKQTVAVTRAVVTDCTRAAGRAQALGRLAAAGGLGFVIGPALGGILAAAVSPLAPPLIAVGLFATAQLLVCACLPETVPSIVAAREFAASLVAVRPVFAAAAHAHALNAALRSGAFAPGDEPQPLRAASGELLPVAAAAPIGADVIRGWRHGGSRSPPAELENLLAAWREDLAVRAASTGGDLVSTGDCEACLKPLFLKARESRGMLPAGTTAALLAGRAASHSDTVAPPRGAASELLTSALAIARCVRERRALLRLCAVRLLAECAILIVHNTFPSYAQDSLGMQPKAIGYIMTCAGAMSVFADIVVLPRLLRPRALDVRSTALAGIAVAALSLPACGAARSTGALVAALVAVSAGASLLRTSLSTLMVNLVPTEDAGTVFGMVDAIESVCRVCAPLLGGLLLKQHGAWAPGAAGGALAVIALVELLVTEPMRLRTPSTSAPPGERATPAVAVNGPSEAKAKHA